MPWQFHNFTCEMKNWRWNFAPKLTNYYSNMGVFPGEWNTIKQMNQSLNEIRYFPIQSSECLHWFTPFLSTKNFGLIFLSLINYYFFMVFYGLVALCSEKDVDCSQEPMTRGSCCEWTVWAILPYRALPLSDHVGQPHSLVRQYNMSFSEQTISKRKHLLVVTCNYTTNLPVSTKVHH